MKDNKFIKNWKNKAEKSLKNKNKKSWAAKSMVAVAGLSNWLKKTEASNNAKAIQNFDDSKQYIEKNKGDASKLIEEYESNLIKDVFLKKNNT